jgi:lactoylglutathione lyase
MSWWRARGSRRDLSCQAAHDDHIARGDNGDHAVGLFQGMFEKNILTFNPAWNSDAQQLREFMDVRELQRQLKARGVKMISEVDESSAGPASFMIVDPDGSTILVDQHV